MKKIIIIILTLLLLSGCTNSTDNYQKASHQDLFDQIQFKDYKNIMIVAHPDDEAIWGGMHLLKDKYLVICLTNGDNQTRAKEFNEVIKQTSGAGIILDYPDKVDGKRDDWSKVKANIKNDLYYLLSNQKFDNIVTHNPKGEYGHEHHKMTCEIVTDISKDLKVTDKLFYFGKYYKKSNPLLSMMKPTYDEKLLKQKKELLKKYISQETVCDHLQHMFPYENWISYANWH
ncbi:PIG-L family deacetylase [Thomasclavelia sp.]|uniref:PIG-L family deacetylase n=1 Tax=Thomasclavelia sp. TaxID=3025757 RepID=UPI0025D5BB67|nr:PIG-L family deacetylase [Thomasclavelia sp.]